MDEFEAGHVKKMREGVHLEGFGQGVCRSRDNVQAR